VLEIIVAWIMLHVSVLPKDHSQIHKYISKDQARLQVEHLLIFKLTNFENFCFKYHIATLALYCMWGFVPEVPLGLVVKVAGMRRVSADSRSVWSSHWSSLASVWTS